MKRLSYHVVTHQLFYSKNSIHPSRTKHIRLKYHFLIEAIEEE